MRLVVIESPYAGDVEANLDYGRRCMLDCLQRGEAPMASHLLYTQCLDDLDNEDRRLGMQAGWEWFDAVDACVVYIDNGISIGMRDGIEAASQCDVKIEFRELGDG